MACGPFCCHPQCWRNSTCEEKDMTFLSDTSKSPALSDQPFCPKLAVQTLTKIAQARQNTAVDSRPSRLQKLMNMIEEKAPEENFLEPPPNFSFTEMQLCLESHGGDGFDNQFYKWIANPRSGKRDLSSKFFENENTRVIHTVNILQQLLPARQKPRSGIAPPRASIKARELFRPNVSPGSNKDYDLFEDSADEALINLIASSRNVLSPRDTPLPAEVAYKKYASTMLPKITRSDSVQTVIQRNEADSQVGSVNSSAKGRYKAKTRPNGIPLTTLTLRLEGETSKVATITDRKVSVPSQYQKNLAYERKSTANVNGTFARVFSGLSTRARQGSVKPSTASTVREQSRQPVTPESVDSFDDPLGYLSARQSFPDNVSNISDRGTDRSLNVSSTTDNTCDAVFGTGEQVPTVEDMMLLASSVTSPDMLSAAQTARAPPASPILIDEVSSRLAADQIPLPERPNSPPWLGLFVYESADGSLASSRAPSVTKRCSPTSGMSSALGSVQRESIAIPLLPSNLND